MDLTKSRLIVSIIALGLIIGACIGGVLYFVLPTFSQNWFVAILLFFTVEESLLLSLVHNFSKKKDKKQLINIYMLTKVIKLFTALGFILIYMLTDKTDMKSFVAVFISFALLFLAAETFLFYKIEKQLSKKIESDE
ncbi:hypothetical protein D0T56_13215 [Dysgonomonas sp. 520]|nr:hypothetical protein [Dysgonomonas sp. 520]